MKKKGYKPLDVVTGRTWKSEKDYMKWKQEKVNISELKRLMAQNKGKMRQVPYLPRHLIEAWMRNPLRNQSELKDIRDFLRDDIDIREMDLHFSAYKVHYTGEGMSVESGEDFGVENFNKKKLEKCMEKEKNPRKKEACEAEWYRRGYS